jgi:hypothetical protein
MWLPSTAGCGQSVAHMQATPHVAAPCMCSGFICTTSAGWAGQGMRCACMWHLWTWGGVRSAAAAGRCTGPTAAMPGACVSRHGRRGLYTCCASQSAQPGPFALHCKKPTCLCMLFLQMPPPHVHPTWNATNPHGSGRSCSGVAAGWSQIWQAAWAGTHSSVHAVPMYRVAWRASLNCTPRSCPLSSCRATVLQPIHAMMALSRIIKRSTGQQGTRLQRFSCEPNQLY